MIPALPLPFATCAPGPAPGAVADAELSLAKAGVGKPVVAGEPCAAAPNAPGALARGLGNPAAGDVAMLERDVRTGPGLPAAIVNSAAVTGDADDDDVQNNIGEALVRVLTAPAALADLALEKRVVTPIVTAGDPVDYVLKVTNNGPDDARAVVVTDMLPPGLLLVGASGDRSIVGDGSLRCELRVVEASAKTRPVIITARSSARWSIAQS